MDKKIFSLQIPEELYKKLMADSQAEYMNLSAFVRKLLLQYYKEKENGGNLQNNK